MSIELALVQVRERMAEAALRAGRQPSAVALIAVSKTFPASAVLQAIAAGQRDFGENRVEEALPKQAQVQAEAGEINPAAHWHLIGHVQSRKAKDAVGTFELIHSVDSLKLAEALNRRSGQAGLQAAVHANQPPVTTSILLECNVSGEASKEGFDLADWQTESAKFDAFVQTVTAIVVLPHIRLRGLMTMAPIVDQADQARPVFARLRALRDALRERFPQVDWIHLSMGMSDDFEAAIAEGSTLVRVGRAIFGGR